MVAVGLLGRTANDCGHVWRIESGTGATHCLRIQCRKALGKAWLRDRAEHMTGPFELACVLEHATVKLGQGLVSILRKGHHKRVLVLKRWNDRVSMLLRILFALRQHFRFVE